MAFTASLLAALRKHQAETPDARKAIRLISKDVLQPRDSIGSPTPQ